MQDPESRESALARLLIDVLSGDDEELESMLAYARAPASLAPERRREIERKLRKSPAFADQLRVLQRMGSRSDLGRTEPRDDTDRG